MPPSEETRNIYDEAALIPTRCWGGAERRGRKGARGPLESSKERMGEDMRIERRFTTEGQSPYAGIAFRAATSEIRNPDGSVVFHLAGIQVPEDWSQVACDVLAQK